MFAVVVTTAVLCKQREKAKENTAKITLKLTGMDNDQEPLTPTNAVPDMSKLRLIKVKLYMLILADDVLRKRILQFDAAETSLTGNGIDTRAVICRRNHIDYRPRCIF